MARTYGSEPSQRRLRSRLLDLFLATVRDIMLLIMRGEAVAIP